MILEDMYNHYDLLQHFKIGLLNKAYSHRDLGYIDGQLKLLDKLIKKETFNVLNELLRKTNYRLLKSIDKGGNNLVDIVKNPEQWQLCKLYGNESQWTNDECLIFSTERMVLVFTKQASGDKYVNNKWQ